MNYLTIYFKIIALRFMGAAQYKLDFVIGVSGLVLQQIVVLLTVAIVFAGVDSLAGFSLYEILFILGLSQIIRGIDLAYNDYVWVEAFGGFSQGSLYSYMTRPLPVYLQIMSQRLNIQSTGPILIGSLILATAMRELKMDWGLIDYVLLGFFIGCGLIILFSVKLLCVVIALFFGRSGELMQVVHEFVEFIRYPLTIYGVVIQGLLLTIIPFGMLSFVPSLYWFVDQPLPLIGQLEWLSRTQTLFAYSGGITLIFLLISQLLWRKGLRQAGVTGT